MRGQELRRVAEASPFRPFRIHMANGKSVVVPHPEFVHVYPGGRMVTVFRSDQSVEIIDVMLVTSLETLPKNGTRPRRDRRKKN